MRLRSFGFVLAVVLFSVPTSRAAEPVDPGLIPEARKVLDYLNTVYGTNVLLGQEALERAEMAHQISGRHPAVVSLDLAAFTSYEGKRWAPGYKAVLARRIEQAKWWHGRGGILTMQWHWPNPLTDEGNVKACRPKFHPIDIKKVITPGTPEHEAAIEDMARHADYLEQLAEARIPVLWRPLHEIDGGWFWWTDTETPENTAGLWRMIFDYMVKDRGLHNLVWVYSAALKAGPKGRDDLAAVDYRRRFYPGDDYVDISGIDIYVSKWHGWPDYRESAYPKAMDIIRRVTPGKMLALCECQGVPNPDRMAADGPRWLYCLPWTVGEAGSTWNGADWIAKTYPHEVLVTLDELPALVPHNVPPVVRLAAPHDGAVLQAGDLEMRAEAVDRDGRVAKVEFLAVPSWHNWYEHDAAERAERLQGSVPLGAADGPPYTCRWRGARPGLYSVLARATDEKGAAAYSNAARVTVGLDNLAAGKAVKASSRQEAGVMAADGDLWSAWLSDKKDAETALTVNLDGAQKVGAVVLVWGRHAGRAYRIQVAAGPDEWKTVHETKSGAGGVEVIRFPPVRPHAIRLVRDEPAEEALRYWLYEFGVYESLPAREGEKAQ
ncbi:MAG: glycosyl hydrolase [Phycisphaerae bacterium]